MLQFECTGHCTSKDNRFLHYLLLDLSTNKKANTKRKCMRSVIKFLPYKFCLRLKLNSLTIAVFCYTNPIDLTKRIFRRRSRTTIDFILGANSFLRANGCTLLGTALHTRIASYDKAFMSKGKDEKSNWQNTVTFHSAIAYKVEIFFIKVQSLKVGQYKIPADENQLG